MNKQHTTGVIAARFQTARLTPGHVHLINTALLQNDAVIVYLGESSVRTKKKPLSFNWRAAMVQGDPRLFRQGANLQIRPINDVRDDDTWSEALIADLEKAVSVKDTLIRLYGSRDSSALKGFVGNYELVEILPLGKFSATEDRQTIAAKFPSGRESDDYIREGMIKAAYDRYPTVFSTVDVAIFQDDLQLGVGVWLGRKPGQKKFRFIGGFANPQSESDEEDVLREAQEETGFIVRNIAYVGNCKVDDWRFRGEQDGIRTRFFVAVADKNVQPHAADDIEELKFVRYCDLVTSTDIIEEHLPLLKKLEEWILTVDDWKFLFN